MENNDIHNNFGGIYVVISSSSYAHCNNIYDKRECGVESAKAYDDTTAVFPGVLKGKNTRGLPHGLYHDPELTWGMPIKPLPRLRIRLAIARKQFRPTRRL